MTKLALGTAQFGLKYGINNSRGKIPISETFEILNKAVETNIDVIDTASAYGASEKILGEYINKLNSKKTIKIISKFPNTSKKKIQEAVNKSLEILHINKFYGYLLHDFSLFKKDKTIWQKLESLKKDNKINKIGFSLYYPEEIEYLLKKDISFDIIQVPYNIFDQRFEKYFDILKKKHVEIHVRSVFLQGLFFKSIQSLDEYFKGIANKLKYLNKLSQEQNVSISAICLNFALVNKSIDKVIIGVDSLENLLENINNQKYLNKVESVYSKLMNMKINDQNILIPMNWPKK
jgi:aryl-alcohol dehydrogenase-like predicted oxidoreductase